MIWSPEQFLNKFGSTLLMKIRGANDKMSTINMQKIQQQWLQTKCHRLFKDTQSYTVQVYSIHQCLASTFLKLAVSKHFSSEQVALWILKIRNDLSTNPLKNKTQSPVDLDSIKITEINQKVVLILQARFLLCSAKAILL